MSLVPQPWNKKQFDQHSSWPLKWPFTLWTAAYHLRFNVTEELTTWIDYTFIVLQMTVPGLSCSSLLAFCFLLCFIAIIGLWIQSCHHTLFGSSDWQVIVWWTWRKVLGNHHWFISDPRCLPGWPSMHRRNSLSRPCAHDESITWGNSSFESNHLSNAVFIKIRRYLCIKCMDPETLTDGSADHYIGQDVQCNHLVHYSLLTLFTWYSHHLLQLLLSKKEQSIYGAPLSLAIRRDSAKFAPRVSHDSQFEQPWLLPCWTTVWQSKNLHPKAFMTLRKKQFCLFW
jgi:hypothetical protein